MNAIAQVDQRGWVGVHHCPSVAPSPPPRSTSANVALYSSNCSCSLRSCQSSRPASADSACRTPPRRDTARLCSRHTMATSSRARSTVPAARSWPRVRPRRGSSPSCHPGRQAAERDVAAASSSSVDAPRGRDTLLSPRRRMPCPVQGERAVVAAARPRFRSRRPRLPGAVSYSSREDHAARSAMRSFALLLRDAGRLLFGLRRRAGRRVRMRTRPSSAECRTPNHFTMRVLQRAKADRRHRPCGWICRRQRRARARARQARRRPRCAAPETRA